MEIFIMFRKLCKQVIDILGSNSDALQGHTYESIRSLLLL